VRRRIERGGSVRGSHTPGKQEPLKDPLPGLKKQLRSEYDELPEERIEQVAKHSLDKYAAAKVREFVPVLAWRHARRHLQHAP
jgi:hypothetical protein